LGEFLKSGGLGFDGVPLNPSPASEGQALCLALAILEPDDLLVWMMKEVLGEERWVGVGEGLCEFRVDDIWIFVPVVDADPHLQRSQLSAAKVILPSIIHIPF
jgi:hypothetical protein